MEATLMMEPPPFSIMCGRASFISKKGAVEIDVHDPLPLFGLESR